MRRTRAGARGVGVDASVDPGPGRIGARGTDHLSVAKRSRREDEGPVPLAGECGPVGWLDSWIGESRRAFLWRTHVLQEQSLYSGKARSSAGGMEKG